MDAKHKKYLLALAVVIIIVIIIVVVRRRREHQGFNVEVETTSKATEGQIPRFVMTQQGDVKSAKRGLPV